MAKAKSKGKGVSSSTLVQIALGFFFVALGIAGIIPQAGEGIFSLSPGRTTLEIVFGVIEVLCGVFFLVDAVKRIPRKTSMLAILVIMCLWALRIFISEFYRGIELRSDGVLFHPNFWNWLLTLSIDLVVASLLWSRYTAE
jgi:hypothetical protein